ncbi:MAG: type II toxin-antitoxin system RelE/ParE family toxin [Spirochaetales bacterium]|nr:type II toxin-antitoxin system RelE/ParE family toxin [Spirochaetales bacterium]
MKNEIILTDNFYEDAKNVSDYIKDTLMNAAAAKTLMSDVRAKIAKLADFPLACPLCDTYRLANLGIRKLVVNNYVVLYSVTEKDEYCDINILHLVYGGRDYSKMRI